MNIKKWLINNTHSLQGKLIGITGASGDLGKEVCKILVGLGANLLLVNRDELKTTKLIGELKQINPNVLIYKEIVDFEKFYEVKKSVEKIRSYKMDVLIVNAGAYKIDRRISDIGYDNVFQINFVSQYYLIREIVMDMNKLGKGKVVAVSSIAYNYSKCDLTDVDFLNNNSCSKVYGNSKRFLMCSLYELFKNIDNVSLSIVHPGISYTNITSHYPKIIFKFIKYPMKIIFSRPKKACLSIVKGIYDECKYFEWIGPKYFNIWGFPSKKIINKCSKEESILIGITSENIYKNLILK